MVASVALTLSWLPDSRRVAALIVGSGVLFGVLGGTPLAGLGSAGTININGVALTPTTPLSSLKGSLIAIQGAGTVKVGP